MASGNLNGLEIVGTVATGLGALLVILIALEVVREAVRAWRQTCRVARYMLGKRWISRVQAEKGAPRKFLKAWVKGFWQGPFSINNVCFPADPTTPLRHNHRRSW